MKGFLFYFQSFEKLENHKKDAAKLRSSKNYIFLEDFITFK